MFDSDDGRKIICLHMEYGMKLFYIMSKNAQFYYTFISISIVTILGASILTYRIILFSKWILPREVRIFSRKPHL